MDTFDIHAFGVRLKAARMARGLSQRALAEQMQVAQGWLSELENGRQTHVQADTVYRFCQALHVSSDILLGLPCTGKGSLALPPASEAR